MSNKRLQSVLNHMKRFKTVNKEDIPLLIKTVEAQMESPKHHGVCPFCLNSDCDYFDSGECDSDDKV